jgi:hypothetical protein
MNRQCRCIAAATSKNHWDKIEEKATTCIFTELIFSDISMTKIKFEI